MGASLSLSISESDLDKSANTSKVKVTLKVSSNSGSWNGSSRSGYIQIDGTKYSFSSSFKMNTTTTLATKTKTVTHDSDGGGKITIKGYYSTGVSAGNISTSKSYTLKTIDRTYSVKYKVNGGDSGTAPDSQTKTYGKTLTLRTSTPTRTGYTFSKWNTKSDGSGTSYNPGASYTKNADLTLYAIWTENTATLTYKTTKLSTPSAVTMTYSNSYTAAGVSAANGYHLSYWKDADGNIYYGGNVIKAANVEPTAITLTAKEIQNTTQTIFYYKTSYTGSWTIYDVEYYSYGSSYTTPAAPTVFDGYKFLGWGTSSTNTGSYLYADTTYSNWNYSSAVTSSISYRSYYAIYVKEDTYNIYQKTLSYIDSSTKTAIYGDTLQTTVKAGESYVLPSISINDYVIDDITYKFTGYWRINKEPENPDYISQGYLSKIVFSSNVIDKLTFNNYYNSTYDLIEAGYTFNNIKSDYNIYPVYEATSGSPITYVQGRADYIVKDDDHPFTSNAYYLFLVGDSSKVTTTIYSNYWAGAFIYANSTDTDVSLYVGNVSIEAQTQKEEGDEWKDWDSSKYEFVTNPNPKVVVINDITYYYITFNDIEDIILKIFSTSTPPEEYYSVRVTLSGLQDSNGIDLDSQTIVFTQPGIIRDINANGTVVSYFKEASESIDTGIDSSLLDINGSIRVSNDVYFKLAAPTTKYPTSSEINLEDPSSGTWADYYDSGTWTGDEASYINLYIALLNLGCDVDTIASIILEVEDATYANVSLFSILLRFMQNTTSLISALDTRVTALESSEGE